MGQAVILLIVDAVLVGVTAEFLVDSINGLTESSGISTQWVGLILLPIVGNAAEHVTAVTVSVKDKLDLSIGVAVGSSIQASSLGLWWCRNKEYCCADALWSNFCRTLCSSFRY